MLSKKLMALMALPPTPAGLVGQQAWTTAGTYSFTVPAGVTSICGVCVGAPGAGGSGTSGRFPYTVGGGGGSLRYVNAVTVEPGEVLTVQVGISSSLYTLPGEPSYIKRGTVLLCQARGGAAGWVQSADVNVGDGGGNGGFGGPTYINNVAGGGGAGGYSGEGGRGVGNSQPATAGSGGGGGGGGISQGGGGIGLLGEGASGAAGGFGGSSGGDQAGGVGGLYGGGPKGGAPTSTTPGAVRIIWGAGRAFPSTNTGNM